MEHRTLREIGEAIRYARLDHGLTEAELAARIGVSRRGISELELGRPGADFMIVLAALESLGLVIQVVDAAGLKQAASR